MFYKWLNPLFFLMSLFGFGFLTVDGTNEDGGDPNDEDGDKGGDDNEEIETDTDTDSDNEITDDTDLLTLDEDTFDSLYDRDDVDTDKLLHAIRVLPKTKDDMHIYLKDVKIQKDGKTADDQQQKTVLPSDKDNVDGVKKDDVKPDAKPEVKPDAGKTDNKQNLVIDENLIQQKVNEFREQNKDKDAATLGQMTDNYKRILEGIKGDTITERALKNYVNAQLYIKTIKSPFDATWKPDNKTVTDPEYIRKATEAKNNYIVAKVQNRFPDFPPDGLQDPESRLAFERELNSTNPRAYREYQELLDTSEHEVNNSYDRWQYVVNNWENMAKDTINTEVKLFTSWLEQKGINTKDISLPSLELDDKFYNQFLYDNILYRKDSNGQSVPNTDVMTFLDNKYPIMKPMAIFAALKDHFIDDIIDAREAAARVQGFNAGKSAMIEPSISEANLHGTIDGVQNDDAVLDNDESSLEQIDSVLQKAKNLILNPKKRR